MSTCLCYVLVYSRDQSVLRKVFHLDKKGREEKLGVSKEWEHILDNTVVISTGSETPFLMKSVQLCTVSRQSAFVRLPPVIQTVGRIYWLVWMLHELLVSYLSAQSTAMRPV